MVITVPTTDYIRASLLTTLNDMVLRGAAAPERQPGLLRAIGTYGLDIARSTAGVEAITGVGFSPSMVQFYMHDATPTNLNWSLGYGDGSSNLCMYQYDTGTVITVSNTKVISIRRGVGNIIQAVLTSLDADGFTLTWTLTGACSITGFFVALP